MGNPSRDSGVARIGVLEIECGGSLAGAVWGAGDTLARLLMNGPEMQQRFPEVNMRSRPDVVEIGSGTGVAGLAAAVGGAASVVLTDMPEAVPRMQRAITRNEECLRGSHVSAASLLWGDEAAIEACAPDGCDLVIATDCLYSPDPADQLGLCSTMVGLARGRDALILHAYEERWENVLAPWPDSLRASGLRRVREEVLPTAHTLAGQLRLPGSLQLTDRRLVVEVLRVDDDALYQ